MAQSTSAYRHAVTKYVRALTASGVKVQNVLLYGSHAKDASHSDSDIDLIIVSKDFAGKQLIERLQLLGQARRHVSEPVQAYGFTPDEVQNRLVSAFWEEILDTEAISITHEILGHQRGQGIRSRSTPGTP